MAMTSIWNPNDEYDLGPYRARIRPMGAGLDEDEGAGAPGVLATKPGMAGVGPERPTDTGPSAAGAADANLSAFQARIQAQGAGAQQQQMALQNILMGQLGQLQEPVSAESPGIREVLAGQRLGLQRGAERERKNAAELRAYDGSGGLGGKAFETDARGILERQGESEAQMTGNVLYQELQGRRDQLRSLLSIAVASGDAASARTLQAELASLQMQMQQSNFYDQMGFNYAGMNQNANLQALMAMLGAL